VWNGISIQHLCVVHDIKYWCGLPGDEAGRLKADIELMEGVARITGDYDFARFVFTGVSAGGGESILFSWRWGFGRNK